MGPWDPAGPRVRIVERPSGEAPEWVRDAWIGMELPLAADDPVTDWILGGVLTTPRSAFLQWLSRRMGRGRAVEGWLVDADASMRLLKNRNPAAATWWRTHAGHWVEPGRLLIFNVQSGERIDDVTPGATG